MRYLLLSSFLIAFCCCSSGRSGGSVPGDVKVFKATGGVWLYKSKIELYGHYLSGLMMIKPDGQDRYKVAITTEFGAKIMDFEIGPGMFKLNNSIPEIQRRRILKLIESDMTILLGFSKQPYDVLRNGKSDPSGKGKPVKYHMTNGDVEQIEVYRGRKKTMDVILTDYQQGLPGIILIEHFGMPVSIELSLLKKKDAAE